MTHSQAIAHLLAPAAAHGDAGTARTPDLIAHVARCSDCWRVLASLEVADADTERAMAAAFGCDATRDVMFALVDLDPAAIRRDHADAARHLGWCLACRTRFAEIVDVERECRRAPRWIELDDRVREAAGRLVVRVGRAVAGLVEIPDAFVLGPAMAPVPVRGGEAVATLARSARVELGGSGAWAEVEVDEADAAAGLALRLLGAGAEPMSVRVCEARPEGETLVARYTLRGDDPVLVRGLWPGSFVVELHDARDAVHRVRLDIDA